MKQLTLVCCGISTINVKKMILNVHFKFRFVIIMVETTLIIHSLVQDLLISKYVLFPICKKVDSGKGIRCCHGGATTAVDVTAKEAVMDD